MGCMPRGLSSFRTRMFVVTIAIVAGVLVGVTVLGWSSVFRYELRGLDERLCGEARRLTMQPPPVGDRGLFEADVGAKLRLNSPEQLLLFFGSADGQARLQSSRWPAGLDIDALDWAPAAFLPPPPPPRRDGPPLPRGVEGDRPMQGEGPPQGPRPDPRRPPVEGMGQGPDGRLAGGFPPRPGLGPPTPCMLASFQHANAEWRAASVETPRARGFVAADQSATVQAMWSALRQAAVIALPLALVLTGLGAWLLSSLAMKPVTRLRDAMKAVDETALDQRLPAEREDREFQDLIDSYNRMLDRLEASFNQASRFSADAAHELKTPLTILQGRLEAAIARSDGQAIQPQLAEMLDEVARLASISRKLLLLSQADAGKLALLPARVDFSLLLDEQLADLRMLAGDALAVRADIEPGLELEADVQLLGQILNNLASNALKYTPAGGRIHLQARRRAGGIELLMGNTANSLSAQDRARFFERFYRADASRTREPGSGHGLGLSLSRMMARAHGGDLSLLPGAEDEVLLRLFLPAGSANLK